MRRRHVSKIRAAPLPGDDGVAAFASVDVADRDAWIAIGAVTIRAGTATRKTIRLLGGSVSARVHAPVAAHRRRTPGALSSRAPAGRPGRVSDRK